MKTTDQRMHRGAGRSDTFEKFARGCARTMGHPIALGGAVLGVVMWAALGPVFAFSDTWQLFINTLTTILTLLMVFLIQNTQNRDSEAMQLKLDELIRATDAAHNALLDIEELSEQELDLLKRRYLQLAERARKNLRDGRSDLGRPEFSHRGRANHYARRHARVRERTHAGGVPQPPPHPKGMDQK